MSRSITITNPADLHDPVAFGYSHVVDAPRPDLVFIAGQYGSGPTGAVDSSDFAAQVERSFAIWAPPSPQPAWTSQTWPASAHTSWITTTRSSKPSSR